MVPPLREAFLAMGAQIEEVIAMFKKMDPRVLDKNVFSAIGDQWMLITAGTAEQCNTMTASWGGLDRKSVV